MSIAKYRPEIDGLRCVAVLAVVLYHVKLLPIPFGYLGVDVFFVISGYLITSIVYTQLAANEFSFFNFYARRLKRLIPALYVMILLTAFVSLWGLSAAERIRLNLSALATIGFVSNFYFWRTTGYFDPAVSDNPLVHTWSLGVEEQYYLLVPMALFFTMSLSIRKVRFAMLVAAFLSFAGALTISKFSENAGFYLPITRFWELGLGSIGALYSIENFKVDEAKGRRSYINWIALIALIALITSLFVSPLGLSQSINQVVSVLATLTLLLVPAAGLVGILLKNRLAVYIGTISYSLYLYHQPIYSFVKLNIVEGYGSLSKLSIICASLLLAVVSHRVVEVPLRQASLNYKSTFLWFGIMSLFLASILTFSLSHSKDELAFEREWGGILASPDRQRCHARKFRSVAESCMYGTEDEAIAVFGDSHGVEVTYALARSPILQTESLYHFTYSSCGPNYQNIGGGCARWAQDKIDFIKSNKKISTVVLAYRFNSILGGDHYYDYPYNEFDIPGDHYLLIKESFKALVEGFIKSNKRVIILAQVPEVPRHIERVLHFEHDRTADAIGVSSEWWRQRSDAFNAMIDELGYGKLVMDSADSFCDSTVCFVEKNGVPLYFDDDHVSVAGAGLVVSNLLDKFAESEPFRVDVKGELF